MARALRYHTMNPNDPQQNETEYSYKEMMDRLRKQRQGGGSSSPGEGGDSSRPAGSQAIEGADGSKQSGEVRRRRKRRTHQPKKVKEERVKVLRRALVLVGIPLGLLLLGAYVLMLSRVRGESFRKAVGERVTELVGAEVEFGRFQLSGLNLNSRKAVVTGDEGGLMRGAEIISLRAQVYPSTMLSRDWLLGFVQASGGVLRFGPTVASGGADVVSSTVAPLSLVAAGIGLGGAPSNIDVSGIKIADCDLFWDGRVPATKPFISESNLSAGDLAQPTIGMGFRGGRLAVPGWPEFGIEAISGDLKRGIYQVRRASLLHTDDGALTLKGQVSILGEGDYRFSGEYSDIDLAEVVHPFWEDKLAGKLDGDITIEGALAKAGMLKAEGEFAIRNLVFSNNRMLKRLSLTLGEALLARLHFRTFQGRYRRAADRVELYDLQGEHLSLLRVRGNIVVFTDGRLEGQLQLGLPEQILAKAEGGKPVFFGIEDDDGFSWVEVSLGGLVDDPREDLTTRLQLALREILREREKVLPGVETLPTRKANAASGALESTFEQLIER